jgi:hypothetical protein
MKFNFKPKKTNLILMIFMIIVLLITCAVWFYLKEYLYFGIFLFLSIIIIHVYFNTTYILNNKYFITKLGFINIKIDYKKIAKVEEVNNKINIKLKSLTLDICPDNKEKFITEINKKVK